MPTGYTAAIQDGISFEEFVLKCARAFGALIEMRDDPSDAKIPDKFQTDTYYAKALAESEKKLEQLNTMTTEEADHAAQVDWSKSEAERLCYLAKTEKIKAAYEAMLAKVRSWEPPTPDHVQLKTFMESQIVESIQFDCGGSYWNNPRPKPTGLEWLAAQKESTLKSIKREREENEKEIARTNERNEWIANLRKSLVKENKQ